jgi:hypothetical protein
VPPRPACSVVVPFAGSDAALEACLTALEALVLRAGDEILVADNRPQARAGRRGPVEIVAAPGPASSYFARGLAAGRAGGEWLVFVDADALPDPACSTRTSRRLPARARRSWRARSPATRIRASARCATTTSTRRRP